jgi:hypothetical protein
MWRRLGTRRARPEPTHPCKRQFCGIRPQCKRARPNRPSVHLLLGPYRFTVARSAGGIPGDRGPFLWADYVRFVPLMSHAAVAACHRQTHGARNPLLNLPRYSRHIAPFYAVESHSMLELNPPRHTRAVWFHGPSRRDALPSWNQRLRPCVSTDRQFPVVNSIGVYAAPCR